MLLYLSYLALALASVFLITLPISLFFQLLIKWERKEKDRRPPGPRLQRVKNIAWLTVAILVVGGIIGNAAVYGARYFGHMFSLERVELDRPVRLLVVSPRHRDILAGGPPQEAPAAVIDDPDVIEAVYGDLEVWWYNRYQYQHVPGYWRTYIVTAFFSEEEWRRAQDLMDEVRREQAAYEEAVASWPGFTERTPFADLPEEEPLQLYPDSPELEAMRLYPVSNDWGGGRVYRFTLSPNYRVQIEEEGGVELRSAYIASRLQKTTYWQLIPR